MATQSTKGGYKDILANVKGGDTIQLWIETNGYAFAKNVKANISVYKKMSKELAESLVKPTNWVAQKAARGHLCGNFLNPSPPFPSF